MAGLDYAQPFTLTVVNVNGFPFRLGFGAAPVCASREGRASSTRNSGLPTWNGRYAARTPVWAGGETGSALPTRSNRCERD